MRRSRYHSPSSLALGLAVGLMGMTLPAPASAQDDCVFDDTLEVRLECSPFQSDPFLFTFDVQIMNTSSPSCAEVLSNCLIESMSYCEPFSQPVLPPGVMATASCFSPSFASSVTVRCEGLVPRQATASAECDAPCSDSDGDGFGNPGDPSCPAGPQTDCDDGDSSIYPGATELCDGVDNDCSGAADDGIAPIPTTCGVGECAGNTGEKTCVGGDFVDSCDPLEGATDEVCDQLDNDCDGDFDEGFDADGDEIVDCLDDCPFDFDNDLDGDGVCGDLDACVDTMIPESVPTKRLRPNRYALVDGDTVFDTARKGAKSRRKGLKSPNYSFDTGDTAGCSCEQIIFALELGNGHLKHGCSISAMQAWTALVNP